MMKDDELIVILRAKAQGLEFSLRWLILEVLRRFETKLREQEQSKWISVKERLPKRRADYLCIYVFGDSEMHFYGVLMFHPEQDAENGYVTGPHFSDEGMEGMRVTHWMPLPEPPKEGAEG